MKLFWTICYWVAAVLVVASIMLSLHYSFGEALFFGTTFLPGALAAKYAFSKMSKGDRGEFVKNAVLVSIGIIVAEIFFFIVAQIVIESMRTGFDHFYEWYAPPSVLQNPAFISIIIGVLVIGSVLFDRFLAGRYPSGPRKITFLSDRHSVTLPTDEIQYVESVDTLTILHTGDGRSFKNKTPISQWEDILDEGFVRIHRSFLVNISAITSFDKDVLYVGEVELPVSRKYKSSVQEIVGA